MLCGTILSTTHFIKVEKMIVSLSWADFKARVSNAKKVRYIDRDSFYVITYQDVGGAFETSILKDSGADQVEFEASYKPSANSLVETPVTLLKTAETVKGHYWTYPINIDLPANSTDPVALDVSFPFPVEMLSGKVVANNLLSGDKLSVKVMVGQVGVLTAAAAQNDTTVTVNSVANIDVGYLLTFAANTSRHLVKAVNTTTKVVTLDTPLVAAFASSDAVKVQVDFIRGDLTIEPIEIYEIGEEAFGGSYLPAGMILKVTATPVSGVARTLRGILAVLY